MSPAHGAARLHSDRAGPKLSPMSQAYDFDAVPPPANEDRAAATFRVPKTAELVADQIRRRIVRG